MEEQPEDRGSWSDRRARRMARRAATWEARKAGPPPPRHIHRAVITVLMLAMMLVLAYVIAFTNPNS